MHLIQMIWMFYAQKFDASSVTSFACDDLIISFSLSVILNIQIYIRTEMGLIKSPLTVYYAWIVTLENKKTNMWDGEEWGSEI